jgi:hypothetical protein
LFTPVTTTTTAGGYASNTSGTTASEGSNDYLSTVSPHIATTSDIVASRHGLSTTTVSTGLKHSASSAALAQHPQAQPELRLSVPPLGAGPGSLGPQSWHGPHHMPTSHSQAVTTPQQYLSAGTSARGSWEFNSYIDANPASAPPVPVTGNSLHFGRDDTDALAKTHQITGT